MVKVGDWVTVQGRPKRVLLQVMEVGNRYVRLNDGTSWFKQTVIKGFESSETYKKDLQRIYGNE